MDKPTKEDQNTFKMAISTIDSCRNQQELEQCVKDLDGLVHPEYMDQLKARFEKRLGEI